MSSTIQLYSLRQVVDMRHKMEDLVKDYFATTRANENTPPLDFDWDTYDTLQKLGKLCLVCAEADDGELLGFVMYIISRHLHHRQSLVAACDMLSVSPKHRGRGLGRQLMAAAEKQLRERKVQIILHNYRTLYDVEPLFPKLGYIEHERSYMKKL